MTLNILWEKIVLLSSIVMLFMGCKSYLPDSFQKEDFTISDLDQLACEYLTRDPFKIDTIIVSGDTSITIDTLYQSLVTFRLRDLVDSTWENQSDSSIIQTLFDSLFFQMNLLLSDTTIVINFPIDEDTGYASFSFEISPITTHKIVFFINDFVTIEMVRDNGETIHEETKFMPSETISGCTEVVTISGQKEVEPFIKTRSIFHLTNSNYLIRFIRSDATLNSTIRTVILEN